MIATMGTPLGDILSGIPINIIVSNNKGISDKC